MFYYVQIAIGDFYYAQLCAKLCVCRVRFDLHYAEIALRAICDFNYARMQIEMYRRRVVGHPFPTV